MKQNWKWRKIQKEKYNKENLRIRLIKQNCKQFSSKRKKNKIDQINWKKLRLTNFLIVQKQRIFFSESSLHSWFFFKISVEQCYQATNVYATLHRPFKEKKLHWFPFFHRSLRKRISQVLLWSPLTQKKGKMKWIF